MAEGHSKKVSELGTVNSVSNSDILIVNANVSGTITTSQISVNNFIQSTVGNSISQSLYTTTLSSNAVVVAAGGTAVTYFSYNRTVYSGAVVLLDMLVSNTASDGGNNRVFGELTVTSNSTVANTTGHFSHIGGTPEIEPEGSATVTGNTVSVELSGPTGNVQVRYLATLFKV